MACTQQRCHPVDRLARPGRLAARHGANETLCWKSGTRNADEFDHCDHERGRSICVARRSSRRAGDDRPQHRDAQGTEPRPLSRLPLASLDTGRYLPAMRTPAQTLTASGYSGRASSRWKGVSEPDASGSLRNWTGNRTHSSLAGPRPFPSPLHPNDSCVRRTWYRAEHRSCTPTSA
jgi:hypothetical protein